MLILVLLVSGVAGAQAPPQGSVAGRIQKSGVERYLGVAALWKAEGQPPDPRKYTIIPVAVVPLSQDGGFELKVPPGRYYLGAILRNSPGPAMGPPRPGDVIFMSPDDKGGSLLVEVAAEARVEVGVNSAGWVFQGAEALAGGPALRGIISDPAGNPVADLLVFAHTDPAMSTLPVAVSARSAADGSYRLRLANPGVVYLRARENYGGGSPVEGGYMGVYGGQEPLAVEVLAEDELEGIHITVNKLPPVGSRRRDLPARPSRPGGAP
ncbi:carboxypeptidase-like regulatory domain-containing protein [Desulfuromonas versatilis]|uniref:carboxypeptidase-like regulatory domain-containing protein n=1 Tax=Desulfuromonas versatilis TaxID=2802975 RepID=UPI001C84489D|nr:carboxypeptidase-like regulatory domain-containing protein [Desulfuromonas versatilis]